MTKKQQKIYDNLTPEQKAVIKDFQDNPNPISKVIFPKGFWGGECVVLDSDGKLWHSDNGVTFKETRAKKYRKMLDE